MAGRRIAERLFKSGRIDYNFKKQREKMRQQINNIIFFLLLTTFTISCSVNKNIVDTNYNFKTASGIPDYGSLNFWAAHPWKHDPSDSLPESLKKNYHPDSTVDVFFVY